MPVEYLLNETRSALQKAVIVGPFVYVPHGLEPFVARQVERVLVGLRGTKSVAEHAFIFPGDPTQSLAQVLQTNIIPPKNPLAFYRTPQTLIERMLQGDPFVGMPRLLEATAGDGAIAAELRKRYPSASVTCGELDPFRRDMLAQQGYPVVENILDYFPQERYGGICTNPPFTCGEDRYYWMRILWYLWRYCLALGGKLISVTANLLRNEGRTKDFLAFVEQYGVWEMNGKEAFRAAGAHVATAIIHLEKPLSYVDEAGLPMFLLDGRHRDCERRAQPVRPARSRRRVSEADLQRAEERRDSVRAWLKDGARQLFQEMQEGRSTHLEAWAAVAARFCWKYSAWNILLIRYQKPDAVHLEGFCTWQDRYRHAVREGEKGVSIQKPLPYKREYERDGGVKEVEEGLGFQVRAVFDITQVEQQREEGRGQRRPRMEEQDTEGDTGVRLPRLPYVPEEQSEQYRQRIWHYASLLSDVVISDEQEQHLVTYRVRFAVMLVLGYYGISAELPQGYHAVWLRELSDQRALMEELEAIRSLAAEVIKAIDQGIDIKLNNALIERRSA